MLCLAIDLLGGDNGSSPFLRGSVIALEQRPELTLILVGDSSLELQLSQVPAHLHSRITTIITDSVVNMDDTAVNALRKKPDSSMAKAIHLHKEGKVNAVVSAGNTAVLVGFGMQILGLIEGMSRPAICTSIPTLSGKTWMLDIGAILQLSAKRLCELAAVGAALSRSYDGNRQPRVGMLNVGREETKGTDELKIAAETMSNTADYDFIGYIEGDQLFNGQQDVIVCDGFSGNIAIKTAQGLSRFLTIELNQALRSNFFTRIIIGLLRSSLKKFANRIDPAMYNGAPLLGLNGLVVKSHGSADERGFANAIVVAAEMAERGLIKSVADSVSKDLPVEDSQFVRLLKKVSLKK